jgi:hypothetical protein
MYNLKGIWKQVETVNNTEACIRMISIVFSVDVTQVLIPLTTKKSLSNEYFAFNLLPFTIKDPCIKWY